MKTSIPPRLPIKRNPKTSRMTPHAGLETLPAPTSARIPTRMLTIALVKKSRDGTRGAKLKRPLRSTPSCGYLTQEFGHSDPKFAGFWKGGLFLFLFGT